MDKKKYIILSIILILLGSFYLVFIKYKAAFTIDNEGYLFTSNKIIEKLNISDLPDNDAKVDYELTSENEKVYKKGSKYYIEKEGKKEINLNFPIISKDGSRVTNLSDNSFLITEDFKVYNTFDNSVLANGVLYNGFSLEQVDKENYLFLGIENNIYLNSVKLLLEKNNEEISIQENSIITFLENEIRYYYLEDEQFKYQRIGGISASDTIKFFDSKLSYKDLLVNLNIISDIEKDDDIIPDIEDEVVKPEKPTKPSIPTDDKDPEYVYIKPDIKGNISGTSVYSIKVDVVLNDPARRVETNPTFEIRYNNRIYVKRVFYSTGTFDIAGLLPNTEFEIIGYYTYRNENDKLMKSTFLETTFKTSDISSLENIKLTYENNEIFPNKIEFENLAFNNNSTDEVLKGIKNAEIIIGDNSYVLSNTIVGNLKKLLTTVYQSPTNLLSNTVYDVQFKFYDIAGNELKTENDKTTTKTSKQRPTVEINVTETELTYFKSEIKFNNPDNVLLENLKYVLVDNQNNIVTQGKLLSNDLKIDDLDVNTIYELIIYGDYDIEDGKGIQKEVRLKSVKISTKPISTLGFMRLLLEEKNISQNEAIYKVNINKSSVDSKLLELLTSINITIKNKETGDFVKKITFKNEDIDDLKNDIAKEIQISSLDSKTEYTIEVDSVVTQGSKDFNIQGVSNIKEFKTLKKEAVVEIINRYTSDNLIDYDVRIYDIDGAISSSRVILEVRDDTGTLIGFKNLEINGEYERLAFDKLEKDEKYTFTYLAEEYNIGYTNITYEQDKVLLEEIITTTESIYGEIYLESLLKEITSKNLFDLSNNTRWKKDGSSTLSDRTTDLDNRIIKMSAKNGYATYSYYLPEGAGKVLKVSFYARHTSNSNKQKVYLSNGGSSNKQIELTDIGTEWKKYTYVIGLNTNNYIGFYIDEIANNNTVTTLEVKDVVMQSYSSLTSSNISDSIYDPKYIFKETVMFRGDDVMPSTGSGTMTGNQNNGFARITNISNNQVSEFSYTGSVQTFTVPSTGNYKIEVWGAAGGGTIGLTSPSRAGRGGYSAGKINLSSGTKLYVYVGEKGKYGSGSNSYKGPVGGWNGGGSGGNSGSGSGGGATDIRLVNGNWNNIESLKSRIIVAGGGGGSDNSGGTYGGGDDGSGGHGGNITSQGAFINGVLSQEYGAGQSPTQYSMFGIGSPVTSSTDSGGGGGGWYGGGATNHGNGGAGGGSSYISGHLGCIAYSKVIPDDDDYIPYNEKNTLMATLYTSIYDSKDELQNKQFYIQILRDGVLENIYEYDMQSIYSTENFMLKYRLQKNATYEIVLSVKIRDRYYPVNSAYFTTEEEIRTIKTIDDFFSIHTNGKYLVLNDLDFTKVNRSVGFWFSGKIDFQGNKIFLDVDGSANQLMSNIQTDAVLSNMDVHFYLNNTTARSNYYGLFYDFRGRVTNLKITVEEATNVEM